MDLDDPTACVLRRRFLMLVVVAVHATCLRHRPHWLAVMLMALVTAIPTADCRLRLIWICVRRILGLLVQENAPALAF
jgi:hypothetical protein